MEPRHRELEADQVEQAENERTRDPEDELGPDEDDTGYDAELDDEPQD